MAFDPTDEEWREQDAVALHRELTELRALPRAVLEHVSTSLTMGAAMLAQRGGEPDASAVMMHAARLLYVLAHERGA